MGVKRSSVNTYMKQPDRLGRAQADRLARYCYGRAAAFEELARDIEAWRDRPRKRRRPFDRGA